MPVPVPSPLQLSDTQSIDNSCNLTLNAINGLLNISLSSVYDDVKIHLNSTDTLI
jgi:hypothetical protein